MAHNKSTPDLDPVPVGRRLRLARTALQLTQKQFGEKADLGSTTIGNYETGQRLVPPGSAVALCKAWGLTLDYIYMGEMGDMRYQLAQAIRSMMDLEEQRHDDDPRPSERQRSRPKP